MVTQALARTILENHDAYQGWSLQGLGMLRLYLTADRSIRMHVWDSRFAFDDVSEMHTHPWDMRSNVIAGVVRQRRFEYMPSGEGTPFMRQAIKCGEGGGFCGAPEQVFLLERPDEVYAGGSYYEQRHDEIHLSRPEDGTVTIVERTVPPGGDPDEAYVFWQAGGEWVSAEPRPASPDEVRAITTHAIERWL